MKDTTRTTFGIPQLPLQIQIKNAKKLDTITSVLEHFGWKQIANRLVYLNKMVLDDPDETPIELESLRIFALFITNQTQLPSPEIGIGLDGLIHAEWRIENHGILTMAFLTSNSVRFVAILKPLKPEDQQWSTQDTQSPDLMIHSIRTFTNLLR